MRVAVAGGSGLLGSAIMPHLESRGHRVLQLVRREVKDPEREIGWNPASDRIDAAAMQGIEVVINLSGENLGSGLWTKEKKRKILSSRVDSTALLARTVAAMEPKPKLFLSASAVGYYGNTGDDVVNEEAPSGSTFLAHVCRKWEAATAPATEAGIRVVVFRLGVVLSKVGGVLEKTLPLFKLGLGGKLGDGRQYMSWVTSEDVARAMEFFISNEQARGPINLSTPNPVTNAEFTTELGKAVKRPTWFRAPEFMLRGALGQMAEEMLLASCRAIPERLSDAGFRFKHPELPEALAAVLA